MSLRRSVRLTTSNALKSPPQEYTTDKSLKTSRKRKSSSSRGEELDKGTTFKKPNVKAIPSKHSQNEIKKKRLDVKPSSASPSAVTPIKTPSQTKETNHRGQLPLDRPVQPHVTNATIVTPGGTQKVTYENGLPQSSPSKTGLPRPTATTGTILAQACDHLTRVDPRMKTLIEKKACPVFTPEGLAEEVNPFKNLTSGICGQQVSGAAAQSIKNKFVALYNEDNLGPHIWPTPAQVAETDLARLRTAGLSQRKAEYIQGLAQKFADGELSTEMLMRASDEELMEKLIAVRGLGRWSVEMFACFGLKRLDILSTGDLGVQRGMAAYFGRDVSKLKAKGGGKWKYMSEKDMLDKSAAYAPYRSLFMWYMWQMADTDINVLDD